MGFALIKDYVDAMLAGKSRSCSLRKVPSQATTAFWWADLSMASGNPLPNYYASTPLEAATLDSDRGIFAGDDTGSGKYLTEMMLCTPTAGLVGAYRLLDYLLYYPFIDGDDTDVQAMDNTTTLPRYTTGEGVMAMYVSVAPTTGSGQFTFDYVDQNGNPKTSPTQFCSVASAGISSLITTQPATVAGGRPFLKLAEGSTGIRSITSVTNLVANGGLGTIVLVKPIAEIAVREINTPSERVWLKEKAPIPHVEDGAYLGLIVNCAATIAAGQLTGRLNFTWS